MRLAAAVAISSKWPIGSGRCCRASWAMSRGAHGSVTVTTVTCALSCLARASPCSRAFVASSEPSVAIRICLYIDDLVTAAFAVIRLMTRSLVSSASVHVEEIRAIGDQTGFEILPLREHRRQACGKGKDVDTQMLQVHQRVASNIKRLGAALEPIER